VRRRRPARRGARRFLDVGAFVVVMLFGGGLGVIIVAFAVGRLRCLRIEEAISVVVTRALGESPDVAAIVSARAAIVAHAHSAGQAHPTVTTVVERRADGVGGEVHAVEFTLRTKACHADCERSLGRLLDANELHALRHAHIPERRTSNGGR
jgi:hypothetical protein